MPDRPVLRLGLWITTALCLVAGLVAVPLVGGEDDAAGSNLAAVAGDESTTTTSTAESAECATAGGCGAGDAAAPAAGAPSTPQGEGSAPAAAGSTATTTAGSGAAAPSTSAQAAPTTTVPPEDLGTPQDPGPAVPPRAGAYRYKVTSSEGSSESTTTIEDKGTTPAETRQRVSTRGDGGFDADNDVAWRKDGVYVLSSEFTFGDRKGTCDWEPDTVQLRLPIAKGTAWESTSTCMVSGFTPAPIQVKRSLVAKVVELRRTRIGGQVVDVWAIDGTDRVEFAGGVIERKGTTLFSPKHGLAVSSSGTASATGNGETREGTYSTELLSLDPA